MALTNNSTVWKFMAVLTFVIMTLFYSFYVFSSIFIVFIFGIIMIMISEKIMFFYNKLFENVNVSKWFKSSIGYVLVFLCLLLVIFLVVSSITDIFTKFNTLQYGDNLLVGIYKQNLEPYIPEVAEGLFFTDENLQNLGKYVVSFISKAVSNLGSFLFKSFLIIPLLFMIYFNRRHSIIKNISDFVPKKFHKATINALKEIGEQMKYYFNAKVLESTIIAIICSIGFYFLGLEGWLFLGILAGFLNIVPFIGPFLGAILPLFVAITHGITSVYWVIGVVLVAQIIDNFYLIPFMIADKVKMDSLFSIILILVASQVFGAFGMIFVIPFYLIGKIILTTGYKELVKIYDHGNNKTLDKTLI